MMKFFKFISTIWLLTTTATSATVGIRDSNSTAPQGIPLDTFSKIPSSTDLIWQPCLSTFFCAVLDVPINYQKPNGTRARVPLIKYPATQEPYQGMLLHNPGGPGVSGIESVFASASYLSSVSGSGFDIVAWEPRGLGFSEPITNCSSTIHIPGIQKRDRAPGQNLPDSFFEEVIRVAKGFGAVCQDKTGGEKDAGPHMNTIVLVRDMISVVDAFARSEDGKRVKRPELLNYWGFSYGTVIGQMFASMFPDRIGRVVLDGVVDADDWMSGKILRLGTLTDDVFLAFFEYCYLAGPKMCSYYSGSSAGDMLKRFEKTVRRFDVKTATQQDWANSSAIILGLEGLKVLARPKLYFPTATFSQLADLLVIYEEISGNISLDAILQMEKQIGQNINLVASPADESLRAISCTDSRNRLYNHTLQDMKPNIRTLRQQSFLFGDWVSAQSANCIGWSIEAAENFEGTFGGHTRNPILFVSNTLDPATPIYNGERSTHLFEKAEHLVIEGLGHTTQASLNKCAFGKITNFFRNGTLPGNDNFCAFEIEPFGLPPTNSTLMVGRNSTEVNIMRRSLLELNRRS